MTNEQFAAVWLFMGTLLQLIVAVAPKPADENRGWQGYTSMIGWMFLLVGAAFAIAAAW